MCKTILTYYTDKQTDLWNCSIACYHVFNFTRKFWKQIKSSWDTYLAQKVTFWKAFEIQSAVSLLMDVQISELARWSRAALPVWVWAVAEWPACEVFKQLLVKGLQEVFRPLFTGHQSTHGIVNSWISSLLVDLAELLESHFVVACRRDVLAWAIWSFHAGSRLLGLLLLLLAQLKLFFVLVQLHRFATNTARFYFCSWLLKMTNKIKH